MPLLLVMDQALRSTELLHRCPATLRRLLPGEWCLVLGMPLFSRLLLRGFCTRLSQFHGEDEATYARSRGVLHHEEHGWSLTCGPATPACASHCRVLDGQGVHSLPPTSQRAWVLMGGGSPCQGNSSLNVSRKGLNDPRSRQPLELRRLRQEFLDLPEMADKELITFLENVASMPATVRASYSAWLGGDPVQIDAASCGWVQRRRLYWLTSSWRSLDRQLQAPSSWDWVPEDGGVPALRYVGEKPLPNKCVFKQGFRPLLDPKAVVQAGGQGAMHPFTREFYHPDENSGVFR
eukprot:s4807_g3.t1